MTDLDRRTLLKRTAIAGLATVPLAGCTGGGGGGSTDTATPEPTEESGGGSTGSGAKWKQTSTVDMTSSLKFVPKRIEVKTGTEVTWKNTGSIGHTVTAYEDEIPDGAAYFASGGFDSQQAAEDGYSNGSKGNIPKGESYSHTFETKGTYKYYCIPHEMNGMIGYVKVV